MHRLVGRRILVVEDDFFVADDLVASLTAHGVEVIGPFATILTGMEAIRSPDRLDGAILDINLAGQMSYPLADALQDRGIPIVFASGYDRTVIPKRFCGVALCMKPVDIAQCADGLFG